MKLVVLWIVTLILVSVRELFLELFLTIRSFSSLDGKLSKMSSQQSTC